MKRKYNNVKIRNKIKAKEIQPIMEVTIEAEEINDSCERLLYGSESLLFCVQAGL